MKMDEFAAFDWIDFPEGRARFVGSVRGVDERGHDAFALEIDNDVLFGEIRPRFLENHNDFNVEIVSFGIRDPGSIGEAPFDPREVLSFAKAETARQLVLRLVDARSEEHTSELQSRRDLVCRLLLEKKKKNKSNHSQPERIQRSPF